MPNTRINSCSLQSNNASSALKSQLGNKVSSGNKYDKDVPMYRLLRTQRSLLWDGKEMYTPNPKRARTDIGRALIQENIDEPYQRDAYIMRGMASCGMRGVYQDNPQNSYVNLSIDSAGGIHWKGVETCKSRYCVKCEGVERRKRAERLECCLQQAHTIQRDDIFFITATQQASHKTDCIVAVREAQTAIINQLRKWNRRHNLDVGYFGAQETLFSRTPNARDDYGRPLNLHTYHSHLHFIIILPKGNRHLWKGLDESLRSWFISAVERNGGKILHPETGQPIAGKFQWRVDECDGDKAITKYITKNVLPVKEITRGDMKQGSSNRGLRELISDITLYDDKADRALYRNWIKTVKGKNLFRETRSLLDNLEQTWRDRIQDNRVERAEHYLSNFDNVDITGEDLRDALSTDYDEVGTRKLPKGNREQNIEHLYEAETNYLDENSTLEEMLERFLKDTRAPCLPYDLASDIIHIVVKERPVLVQEQSEDDEKKTLYSIDIPTPLYNYLMSTRLIEDVVPVLQECALQGYSTFFEYEFRKLCEKMETDKPSSYFVEGGEFDIHFRSLL